MIQLIINICVAIGFLSLAISIIPKIVGSINVIRTGKANREQLKKFPIHISILNTLEIICIIICYVKVFMLYYNL